jgi:hypothetical protein
MFTFHLTFTMPPFYLSHGSCSTMLTVHPCLTSSVCFQITWQFSGTQTPPIVSHMYPLCIFVHCHIKHEKILINNSAYCQEIGWNIAVELFALLRIQQVMDSNLSLETGCLTDFPWFSSVHVVKWRPWMLPSTSIPTHYSLIALPFSAIDTCSLSCTHSCLINHMVA